MNKFYLFLIFFSIYHHAQTIIGSVHDSLNKSVLPFSNIVLLSGKGINSDEKGNFQFDISQNLSDTLKISSTGYVSKYFPISDFESLKIINLQVLLIPKIINIDDVIIYKDKTKYNIKETLGESKEGNIEMSSLIGYETCILLQNPHQNISGKIKKVYIDLKKRKNATYLAMFNVKFYKYDAINNVPGEEIYNKNLFVNPKNQKYRLWIDVEDFNIKFPKDGICIGVEFINTSGKVEKYARFGPMFRYTVSKNSKSITWSNYQNSGWKKGSTNHNNGKINPMIGLEVLYPPN